jgi:prepilin-type N-terminal cleavage/methylation domain-containing protein
MKNLFLEKRIALGLSKGFTVIEILVVLAILGFLIMIVVPSFQTMRSNQILKSAVLDVVSALEKSKSQTLSSIDSSEYGVHFATDEVVIFKGQTFSSGDPNNEKVPLSSGVSVSAINLTGGATDFYWNKLSGVPTKTGSVTVSTSSTSKIITISATGAVSVN